MLAKDPMDRYPNADALLADLSALESAVARKAEPQAISLTRIRFPVSIGLLLAILSLGSGLWILRNSRWRAAAPRPMPIHSTLTRLTDLSGRAWFPSLSPDGKLFLYAKRMGERSHLFLQRVGGGNPIDLLPSSQSDSQATFSPDGQRIAFRSERNGGGLFVMGVKGQSVRRAADFGFNPSWSPDGKEIVCATEGITNPRIRRLPKSEIFRIKLATGEWHRICLGDAVQPSWSPHGFRIAYWGVVSPSGQRAIWTIPASGGSRIQVTDSSYIDWNPVWSPDGRFLYFVSDRNGVMNLWRVPIEERSGRVLGKPEPVTTSSQASLLPSISQDGRRIAYASDDSKTILEKVAFDPVSGTTKGAPVAIAQTSQMILLLDASRNGIVFQTSVPQENIVLARPDGSEPRQLVGGSFRNRQPRLSPNGTRVAFYSDRGGRYEIWTVRADGSQIERAAVIPGRPAYHPIWSPDGQQIACDVDVNEALIDLTQPPAKRRARLLPLPGRGMGFIASSWSANGRWLAGVLHREDGVQTRGIVLYSIDGRRYERMTDRGEAPLWLSDSRRLLYWDDNKLFLLDTTSRTSRQVFVAPSGVTYNDLSLSPDDRALYFVRSTDEGDIWLLTLKSHDVPQGPRPA